MSVMAVSPGKSRSGGRRRPLVTAGLMGLSCALPYGVLTSLIQVWLKDAQVPVQSIGLLALATLPYGLKFIWAPFLDRYSWPFLGRRRGWIVFSQLGLGGAIIGLAFLDPTFFELVGLWAVLIGFLSATQDTVVDAYRREDLTDEELGQGSAYYLWGYRLGLILVGSGGLVLADRAPWATVFFVLGGMLILNPLVLLFSPEPRQEQPSPENMITAVWAPLKDYFQRPGALLFLLFILFYKLGDQLAAHMLAVFYQQIGYSKTEIGLVGKFFGAGATILGAWGGWRGLKHWGLWKSLFVFGLFQCFSTLVFVALAQLPPHRFYLGTAVTIENLAAGAGTAAFMTFMAYLTNRRFTAFQYALLSSLMGAARAVLAAPTGFLIEAVGWAYFYVFCALAALPGLLILMGIKPLTEELGPRPDKGGL